MTEMNENLKAVPDVPALPSDLIYLSSGVVLRPVKIPILLIQRLQKQLVAPVPPYEWLEEKQRKEYNYQDPKYLREVAQHEAEVSDSYINIFAAYGTEIEFVPEDVYGLDDPRWVEDFQPLYDEEIPTSGKRRYLTWLQCVALVTTDDIQNLAFAVRTLMGVTEEMVADQLDGFPSNP